MYPISELLDCTTIEQVMQVKRKYADRLSGNWKFENWITKTLNRINYEKRNKIQSVGNS
jgi:hypothetical protein